MSFVVPGIAVAEVPKFAWKTKFIVFDVNPPTLNTLHEVFHEISGCRLLRFSIQQTNTPTDSEQIDILLTRDGTATLYDGSAVDSLLNATNYNVYLGSGVAILTAEEMAVSVNNVPPIIGSIDVPYSGMAIEGHDVKVEVRQTSPIEAGARIRATVWVQTLEAV